ncbi:MAG: hypothetical protein E7015_01730 [Alphaproteobacteria bacterium]|nr:hypothetical protein [Alphaproteobacteria bacterium]
MLKKIVVMFVFTPFWMCFGLDVKVNVFQETINKQALALNLKESLEQIRTESREADLFIRKYFDKEEFVSDHFEIEIVERVDKAATYVASRLYEKGRENPTDTEILERALLFIGRENGVNGIDSCSEATMNSVASLRSDIENLLSLRKKYNMSVNGPEFQAFLEGLKNILSND